VCLHYSTTKQLINFSQPDKNLCFHTQADTSGTGRRRQNGQNCIPIFLADTNVSILYEKRK